MSPLLAKGPSGMFPPNVGRCRDCFLWRAVTMPPVPHNVSCAPKPAFECARLRRPISHRNRRRGATCVDARTSAARSPGATRAGLQLDLRRGQAHLRGSWHGCPTSDPRGEGRIVRAAEFDQGHCRVGPIRHGPGRKRRRHACQQRSAPTAPIGPVMADTAGEVFELAPRLRQRAGGFEPCRRQIRSARWRSRRRVLSCQSVPSSVAIRSRRCRTVLRWM